MTYNLLKEFIVHQPLPDNFYSDTLIGKTIPAINLPTTDGRMVNLAELKSDFTVLYIYPRTSPPNQPSLKDWDIIPGAKGCTPQACAFRDHYQEIRQLNATVFGLSTQDTVYQTEAVQRLHLPFPLLSDRNLLFTQALGLPTFTVDGYILLRRLTMIIQQDKIRQVMYPVHNPAANAADVIALLSNFYKL